MTFASLSAKVGQYRLLLVTNELVLLQQGDGSERCDDILVVPGQATGSWNCWCVMVFIRCCHKPFFNPVMIVLHLF